MQLLTTLTSYTMHVTCALFVDITECQLSEGDSSFRLTYSLQFDCVNLSVECLVLHIINKK